MSSLAGLVRRSARRACLLLFVVVAAVLAGEWAPREAGATFPGYPGKIIFSSDRSGRMYLYTMNSNGTCRKRLPSLGGEPAWSPDGTKLAFGGGVIAIADADGSNITVITPDQANRSPDWSPDGQKIVFVSERDGNPEIYVMDKDGSNQTNITNNPWSDTTPAWSPDGSRIAFASNRSDIPDQVVYYQDIYVMDPDGNNVENLTMSSSESEDGPDWSPNGSQIAYTAGLTSEIYVMNSDGANPVSIADGWAPKWSPDGEHIAFVRNGPPTDELDIFVVKPDGSEETNLTYYKFGRNDGWHDWQPLPAPVTGIDIGKVVNGEAYNASWIFSSEELGDFTLPAEGGCQSFEDLVPGTYTITEAAVPGYNQSVRCDNGQQGVNSITVDLAQDQRIACTFTNSTPPKLKLYSYVTGPPPPSDLTITGDLGDFTLPAVSGEKLFEDLLPGEYTFMVTPVEGYKTWISCQPDNLVTENSRTLELEYGQYIECGINLDKQGSITLEVEVRGTPGPDEWQFLPSHIIPNFSIPAAGGTIRFDEVDDDSYNFYVEPVLNFTSSASCSSGDTGEWLVAAYVSDGADITCKFIFTRLGIMMLPFVIGDPPKVKTGTTTLISRHSDGTIGNGRSEKGATAISADGRFVAFSSDATNLVDNDTNKAVTDVFVHDRQTGQTSLISRHTNGTQGDGGSSGASISADGRFVAFHSQASNLVDNDTAGRQHIFLHDRQSGQTTIISRHTDGTPGNSGSVNPAISSDGRYVAFGSNAANLIDNDTNNQSDVFVHDRQTGETTLISRHSNGTQGNVGSDQASISADGRLVAFRSQAGNLVDNDTNGENYDIFVHDRQTAQTSLVSRHSNGTQGAGYYLSHPSISANGRFVAFASSSSFVDNDTNGDVYDIFVHDRQTGQTSLISRRTDGTQVSSVSTYPSISADGRFVAFNSDNLTILDSLRGFDIYVHDRQTGVTTLISRRTDGEQANDRTAEPSISADGQVVAFIAWADNLVDGDNNDHIDIFAHHLSEK